MGYAISWIAVKNKSEKDVHEYFGFSETSETEEIPESNISASMLPGGWYLIWFNRCESPYVQHEVMATLSRNCSVVACVVEEHVMYSRSEYWENGELIWKIIHDSQIGIYDLQASGDLPDDFERMKSDIFAQQDSAGGDKADVDYIFDLPLEPLKKMTFFKHDEESPELRGVEYKVLASNRKRFPMNKPKAWWKIWQ